MPKFEKSLGNHARLVITAQARNILKFRHVDEAKFVQKLTEMFQSCFTEQEYPFHAIVVCKSTYFDKDECLKVEIFDSWK